MNNPTFAWILQVGKNESPFKGPYYTEDAKRYGRSYTHELVFLLHMEDLSNSVKERLRHAQPGTKIKVARLGNRLGWDGGEETLFLRRLTGPELDLLDKAASIKAQLAQNEEYIQLSIPDSLKLEKTRLEQEQKELKKLLKQSNLL